MKKIILLLVAMITVQYVFSAEKDAVRSGTAIFINNEGYAVTYYRLVSEALEISSLINNKPVQFEFVEGDFLSDLAVIKAKEKISSKPAELLLGESKPGIPVVCIACSKDEGKSQLIVSGNLKLISGIEGDIRHMQLEFQKNSIPMEGPVFDETGLCIGLISNRITDIYSLIQNVPSDKSIVIAKKIEYLFPLLKNISNVKWVKEGTALAPEEKAKIQKESVFAIDIKGKIPAGKEVSPSDFESIRAQIPANVLFIYVDASSGYDNAGFAEMLLDALNKNKIGKNIQPTLKQQYYNAVFAKFGQPNLSAEELIKMCSDLAEGFFLKAGCNIITGQVEDIVELKLYKPHSSDILAQARIKKIITSEPQNALKELTDTAVKNLVRELKAKKIKNIFVK